MSLLVRPGRNVWLLARTDRDHPTADVAAQTGAAWLNRVLAGQTILPLSSPDSPPGRQRYYLEAARPLDVWAMQARPDLPAPPAPSATALAPTWRWRREEQPEPFALDAERPWYVVADFDWRGQTKEITPWPHRAVGPLGLPVERATGLDWLLLEARYLGEAGRPDSTWSGDVRRSVEQGVRSAGDWALIAAVIALAIAYRRR